MSHLAKIQLLIICCKLQHRNTLSLAAVNTLSTIFYWKPMESVLKNAYHHIQNEELEQGLEIISSHLLVDCIMLMASITKEQNKYELYSLFYDNYLDFAGKVRENKFDYVSDASLKSFFKTGCTHRAREYNRAFRKPDDWISETFFEKNISRFDEIFDENCQSEYEMVQEKYGIDLGQMETDVDFPMEVVRAFHTLNEKCKFLLVLKYMLNLSHKDIVDCLCHFYELKNVNVSKTELKRCLDNLRKRSENRMN